LLDATRWAASDCLRAEEVPVLTVDATLGRYRAQRDLLEQYVRLMEEDWPELTEGERHECLVSLNQFCDLIDIWRSRTTRDWRTRDA
jgi:hypothetical protein